MEFESKLLEEQDVLEVNSYGVNYEGYSSLIMHDLPELPQVVVTSQYQPEVIPAWLLFGEF